MHSINLSLVGLMSSACFCSFFSRAFCEGRKEKRHKSDNRCEPSGMLTAGGSKDGKVVRSDSNLPNRLMHPQRGDLNRILPGPWFRRPWLLGLPAYCRYLENTQKALPRLLRRPRFTNQLQRGLEGQRATAWNATSTTEVSSFGNPALNSRAAMLKAFERLRTPLKAFGLHVFKISRMHNRSTYSERPERPESKSPDASTLEGSWKLRDLR